MDFPRSVCRSATLSTVTRRNEPEKRVLVVAPQIHDDIEPREQTQKEDHMLVYGWGKGARQLGTVGPVCCPHCQTTGHWSVIETSRHATLYFIKVAR